MLKTVEAERKALRQAVESGDFAAAEASVGRYAGLLSSAIPQLPPAEALRQLEDACGTVDWARRTLRVARTRLRCLGEYAAGASGTPHTWKVDV